MSWRDSQADCSREGAGSPSALRDGGKGWLYAGWGGAELHQTLAEAWTQSSHSTQVGLTLSLPSLCYDWVGTQEASRVFCDSSGEGLINSLVELLGSELSLRGSERQKPREGPPGRGHSLDTGREVGRACESRKGRAGCISLSGLSF